MPPPYWPADLPPSAVDLIRSESSSPEPTADAGNSRLSRQSTLRMNSDDSAPQRNRVSRGRIRSTFLNPEDAREELRASYLLPPEAVVRRGPTALPMSESVSYDRSAWTPSPSVELGSKKSGYFGSALDVSTLPKTSRPQAVLRSKSDESSETTYGKLFPLRPSSSENVKVIQDVPLPPPVQPSWRERNGWLFDPLSVTLGRHTSKKYATTTEKSFFERPRTVALRRRKGLLVGAAILVMLLVVALGAGLGAGLKKHKHEQSSPQPLSLSVVDNLVDDSQAGLLQNGVYRTSYDDVANVLQFDGSAKLAFDSISGTPDVVIQRGSGTNLTGFGASLNDATAIVLSQLKAADPGNYHTTLQALFNHRSGLNVLRVPIGATDFSTEMYTWADQRAGGQGATPAQALANLNAQPAEQRLFPVLRDILQVNPEIKLMVLPWSPPAWLKKWGTLQGGPLADNATNYVVEYLAQSAQAFTQAMGVQPWALSVQNEPTNPTSYPSALIEPKHELTLLSMLRGRMAELGMSRTKLVGLEDNSVYYSTALHLLNNNASSVDAIAWHCYNGSYDLVDKFTSQAKDKLNGKDLMSTECSGLIDKSIKFDQGWVSSAQWWMSELLMPTMQRNFTVALAWNLALDNNLGPRLSEAYCDNCLGTVQVDGQDVYPGAPQQALFNHFSLASANLTRFGGGQAHHTPVILSSKQAQKCLEATAFTAPWDLQSKKDRYGLVAHNTCSKLSSINVAMEASGHAEKVNIPYGVTTLVWSL